MNHDPAHAQADHDAGAEPRLIDHLIELRARLLRAVVGLLAVFLVLMPFSADIYGLLAAPLLANLPASGQLAASAARAGKVNRVMEPLLNWHEGNMPTGR